MKILKTEILRQPGEYLRDRFNKILEEDVLVYLSMIIWLVVFTVLEWVNWYFDLPRKPVSWTIMSFLIIVFCLFKMRKATKELRNIKKGELGERVVAQVLDELKKIDCEILNDISTGRGNIDHVVISEKGIFVIETKFRQKYFSRLKVFFDGENIFINNKKEEKLINQVLAEKNWLVDKIKEKLNKDFIIKPVLIFVEWYIDSESQKRIEEKYGIWLLNEKALVKYIQNSPNVISKENKDLIYQTLKSFVILIQ